MRLAFIDTIPLWGGGELWMLQTAMALVRRGHAVSVLAADNGKLLLRARAAGLPSAGTPAHPLWHPRRRRELRAWIAPQEPQVYVANCGADVRLAQALQARRRVPVIFRRGLDRPLRDDFLHRRTFRRVDAILANSAATRDTVCASLRWLAPTAVHVLHNGIDTEAFLDFAARDVRRLLGIAPTAFVIGIVGRLTSQKGHRTLFEALPRIVAGRPDVQVLVVGEGELRQELRARAAQSAHASRWHFVGHVDVVQPYYEACDVVAIPSWFEGFCFTAVEAQLLERPVVASNASSLPEVIADGSTGFLVPPGDAAALAERLLQLSADPELRRRLGRRGAELVRQRFAAPAILDALEALVEGIIERASRAVERSAGAEPLGTATERTTPASPRASD